jgi:DNA repair exonuclease SbcCD nuclease subunit
MRLLITGDAHITNRKPKNRKDDYFRTVLNKFEQECQIAVEEKCDIVILPGDVFNSWKENHLVVQCIINIMKSYPSLHFLCVAGQHDQQFHSTDLSGTTLGTLLTHTDLIRLIPNNSDDFIWIDSDDPDSCPDINIYGYSWNDINLPIPQIEHPKNINILVLHKMIVDEKLWAEQEGHTWANHLLINTDFDLIVSGDNHKQFFARKGKKHLLNVGSMMRSTIDQMDHHPAVAVYDTKTKEVDIIDLDYKPFDEVMQIAKAEQEKERNLQLESFVKSLKKYEGVTTNEDPKINFKNAVTNYCERNNISEAIKNVISDCFKDLK